MQRMISLYGVYIMNHSATAKRPLSLGGVRSFLIAYECDPPDANRHIYARLFVPPAVYLPVVEGSLLSDSYRRVLRMIK